MLQATGGCAKASGTLSPTPAPPHVLDLRFEGLPVAQQRAELDSEKKPVVIAGESARLTFEELIEADSLSAMKQGYAELGFTPQSEKQLLDKIRIDWQQAQKEQVALALKYGNGMPHFRQITQAGVTYRICGILHSTDVADEYREALAKIISKENLCLVEEGINSDIFQEIGGLEIPDHSAPPYWRRAVQTGIELISYCGRVLRKIAEPLRAGMSNAEQINLAVRVPCEILHDLPVAIDLELKARTGRYSIVDLRSAYMAEMVRKVNSNEFSEKAIVCGAVHAAQIDYFLKNPINNKRVQYLAEKHTSVVNDCGLPGFALEMNKIKRIQGLLMIPAMAISFYVICKSIHLSAGWLVSML